MATHSDLWRPHEGRVSSMVEKLGWRRLFPPLRKAWERLGPLRPEVAGAIGLKPTVSVVCGAHDSNASLVPHLASRRDPFTVISTGTWVIIMAVGGKGRLEPKADMLANVDVRGEPVPTARFMGGREFAVLAGYRPAEATEAAVASIVASGVMALPAFSDQGGPFAGRRGSIVGPVPVTPEARTALAAAYVALMTAHMLDRLAAPGDLIVEGGLTPDACLRRAVLAGLMPGRRGPCRPDERGRGRRRGAARPLGRASGPAAARSGARLDDPRTSRLSGAMGKGSVKNAAAAAHSGLRNLSVIRSDSPIASYLAWSKLGSGGWPCGALRRVGGKVQTPNG